MKQQVALVALQMAARWDDYASESKFKKRVSGLTRQARQKTDAKHPALIVFPEDVGLGLIFTEHFAQVKECRTIQEAGLQLIQIRASELMPLLPKEASQPEMVRALLRCSSPFVQRAYLDAFSQAAKDSQCWLIAGSAPIAGDDGQVYNTTYSFSPKGEWIHTQRKVKLVPLEAESGLNLSPAPARNLSVFETPFGKVGVLICYDLFFPELVKQVVDLGAEIVAQPSFNPPPWTDSERQQWETGILAAVQKHPSLIGINPMMTGSLLDIAPSGVSSIVTHKERTPDQSGYLVKAKSALKEEILVYVWAR
ncbi:MAG: hypothetical protein KIT45_05985 [Fimbriimonadia bacterium]|nr:hypothetical protein [Fimbriimonadia bacterium]